MAYAFAQMPVSYVHQRLYMQVRQEEGEADRQADGDYQRWVDFGLRKAQMQCVRTRTWV